MEGVVEAKVRITVVVLCGARTAHRSKALVVDNILFYGADLTVCINGHT